MSLVSGFYKLAPSSAPTNEDERRIRLKKFLKILTTKYGLEEVRARIALTLVPKDMEDIKTFILRQL